MFILGNTSEQNFERAERSHEIMRSGASEVMLQMVSKNARAVNNAANSPTILEAMQRANEARLARDQADEEARIAAETAAAPEVPVATVTDINEYRAKVEEVRNQQQAA